LAARDLIVKYSMKSAIRAAFPSFTPNRWYSLPRFVASDSGARRKILRLTVARRRRLFTVFPCAESPVIVDGDAQKMSERRC
jgi:hypothetical protein